MRQIVSVSGAVCQVQDTESGDLSTGTLVVDDDDVVHFLPEKAHTHQVAQAPEGVRAADEEIGSPEADPTG